MHNCLIKMQHLVLKNSQIQPPNIAINLVQIMPLLHYEQEVQLISYHSRKRSPTVYSAFTHKIKSKKAFWRRLKNCTLEQLFEKVYLQGRVYLRLLVNSQTNQITNNRIADWSIHGLDKSRTRQLVDRSTSGLVNSWTGQVADTLVNSRTLRSTCRWTVGGLINSRILGSNLGLPDNWRTVQLSNR